jgi:hypothetical protein
MTQVHYRPKKGFRDIRGHRSSCYRKIPHESRELAEQYLVDHPHNEQFRWRVYRCQWCNAWHITKKA